MLAALRAGIIKLVLPARYRRDLKDIPAEARENIRLVWLERVEEPIDAALAVETAAALSS